MELFTNPLDYTKCADLMVSRSKTFIFKCIFCRNIGKTFDIFCAHLPTCCPSILKEKDEDNSNHIFIKKTFIKNWKKKHPPIPPPPPPELPANIHEIADQQLQKTAPTALHDQNKENVQILKDFNKNIQEKEKGTVSSKEPPIITNVVTIPPIPGLTITPIGGITITKVGSSISNDNKSGRENEADTIITQVSPNTEDSNPTLTTEVEVNNIEISNVTEESSNAMVSEITFEETVPDPPVQPTISPEERPFNIEDLPIVVEIPIIPKIEKDAEIGDIVTVPKLVDIEKFTIKQEVVSPVRSTAPNPFTDDNEVIKENVMVQIPQENLVIPKTQPAEEQTPQKKKRGRKKKVPEPPMTQIFVPDPPVTIKRKSDTQKTAPNKKKKVEEKAKKTRTKKGRSKSLQELSSSPKHLRVKSPLELNDILKAKHSDFHVPKSAEKRVISGMKKSIINAMEKKNSVP
ncbi:hypothetical protein ACFFRR_008239 [Megaselia abdita]